MLFLTLSSLCGLIVSVCLARIAMDGYHMRNLDRSWVRHNSWLLSLNLTVVLCSIGRVIHKGPLDNFAAVTCLFVAEQTSFCLFLAMLFGSPEIGRENEDPPNFCAKLTGA